MVLAQRSDIVLLDEPTTFLDATHQLELLDLLTDLNRDRGATVVMVLHDLNLAARYADHLVVMAAGGHRRAGHTGRGHHGGDRAGGLRPRVRRDDGPRRRVAARHPDRTAPPRQLELG